MEHIVRRIEAEERGPRRIPPSENLRLSPGCKQAANYAIGATASDTKRVNTRQLLKALLQQESTITARILRDFGMRSSSLNRLTTSQADDRAGRFPR